MAGNDGYTKLLLHANEADTSTTPADSSGSAHTMTANGNAQVDTAQVPPLTGATGALLFDGATDYFSSPDSTDWNLGASGAGNDWTIDLWYRPVSNGNDTFFWVGGGGATGWVIYREQSNSSIDIFSDGAHDYISFSPTLDTWVHVAWVKSGTTITMYVAGTSTGTSADKGMNNDSSALLIGSDNGGAYNLDGHLGEVRISKGIARWTANFTPETAQYSVDTPSMSSWFRGVALPPVNTWGLILS